VSKKSQQKKEAKEEKCLPQGKPFIRQKNYNMVVVVVLGA
jgi:hypothetical protein